MGMFKTKSFFREFSCQMKTFGSMLSTPLLQVLDETPRVRAFFKAHTLQVASDKKQENTDAAQAEAGVHSRMSSYMEASGVIRQREQWKRAGLLEYLE